MQENVKELRKIEIDPKQIDRNFERRVAECANEISKILNKETKLGFTSEKLVQ